MEIARPATGNRANCKSAQTDWWYVEYFVHKRDVLRPRLQLNGVYQGRRAGVEEEEDHLDCVIIISDCDPVTVTAVEHHREHRHRDGRRARDCRDANWRAISGLQRIR